MLMTSSKFEALVRKRLSQEMLEQNSNLEMDLIQKQADIVYLQNQINPHFLYNTLECIRGEALSEGMTDLADTVKALAQFFRYGISVRGSVVTFEDELKNLENYISLQQYRFKNKFSFDVMIDEKDSDEIRKCQIPKLSLQPIVENSIIHAFQDISSGGELRLRAERAGDNVSIIISDNGKGMTFDTLWKLNEKIQTEKLEEPQDHGVGLRNVHRRIQLLFGKEYGITVKSFPDIGTFVEIFLPYKTGEL